MFTTNTEKIIKSLKTSEEGKTLAQLQKELKINKSSLFYEIKKLEEEGFITKNIITSKNIKYVLSDKANLKKFISNYKDKLEKLLLENQDNRLSSKPKLVFVDDYKLTDDMISKLNKKFDISIYTDSSPFISEDLLFLRAKEAEVMVIFYSITLTRELLLKLPNLKVIITPTITKDYIDKKTCEELGIEIKTLTWESNYKRSARREFVFASLFALLRPIHVAQEHLKAGFFDYRTFDAQEIKGKKIGIAGAKNFGADMVPIFKAFGADVYIANPDKENIDKFELGVSKFYTIDALFKTCDIIVFPEDYKRTIDITSFMSEPMEAKYIIIHTHKVRYDLEKFREYIIRGKLKGLHIDYYSDVFKLFKNFPNSDYRKIMNFPNVIVTPEIAFYTQESMQINKFQVYEILMNL